MRSAHRIILGMILGPGLLAVTIPKLPGQNPNNPKGIDVSSYQGTNNWTSIKNSGISFAFIKASEGLTITDPDFAANWAGAKAAGVVRGAYHFARPSTSPSVSASAIAQANYFINIVKPSKGDIQLACDFEVTGGLGATDLGNWLTTFCQQVQSVTHTPAIIYTYTAFWSNMPTSWSNSSLNCGLWIANYNPPSGSPGIPAPWSSSGYAFWQYTSSGTSSDVSGIGDYSGGLDLDTFNGSMSLLLKFTYPRDPMAARR